MAMQMDCYAAALMCCFSLPCVLCSVLRNCVRCADFLAAVVCLAVVETFAGRQLLQGNVGGRGGTPGSTPGRAFSAVANHKQPTAPRITRKSFDRAMPGKHLLADELAAGQLCRCSQLIVAPASCMWT
jgi:hypothetical protein